MIEDYTANMWTDTEANLISDDETPVAGQSIFAYDTGAFVIGDDVTSYASMKPVYYDFVNGRFGVGIEPGQVGHFYNLSATCFIKVESGGLNTAGVIIENTAREYSLNVSAPSGLFYISDSTAGTNPFQIEPACPTNLLYLDSGGKVGIKTTTPAQDLHVYDASSSAYVLIESGASQIAGIVLKNADNEFQIDNRHSTTQLRFVDNTNAAIPMVIESSALSHSIYMKSDGGIEFHNLLGSTGSSDARYNTSTKELFYDTSASKFKKNFKKYKGEIDLSALEVEVYDRIDDSYIDEVGLVAEKVETVFPKICYYNEDGEILGYNKSDLVPVLLYEIQELKKEIAELKKTA